MVGLVDEGRIVIIDWTKPIEAVNIETGEASPVSFVEDCDDGSGDVAVSGVPDGYEVFTPQGDHFLAVDGGCEYRIRNVSN